MTIVLVTLGAAVTALVVSYVVTPLTERLAHRFGVLDHPMDQTHKVHARPTPYLGGVAIFCGLIAGSSLVLAILRSDVVWLLRGFPLAIGVALILGVLGLADDVKTLPRIVRLVAQIAAGSAAYVSDFRVALTPSEPLNLILTMVWIVGITNAFNLLDNMDGLTAGIAGVAAASFAIMGLIGQMPVLAIVAAALAGASFGFLAHNKHPAKIFMGDAGSLFLGLLLALIGMRLRFTNLVEVTFLIPVIVLGLPIFDTTLVVLSRLRHGRSIFTGGRDHVSHRLVRLGLPVSAAVGILYFTGICLGWLGIVLSRANPDVGWMLLSFVFALGLFFGSLLWRIPVYDEPEAIATDLRATEREGEGYLAIDNAADPQLLEESG